MKETSAKKNYRMYLELIMVGIALYFVKKFGKMATMTTSLVVTVRMILTKTVMQRKIKITTLKMILKKSGKGGPIYHHMRCLYIVIF